MGANDFDVYNFLRGFAVTGETREEVINKYIKGTIDKDEFMRRMENAKD